MPNNTIQIKFLANSQSVFFWRDVPVFKTVEFTTEGELNNYLDKLATNIFESTGYEVKEFRWNRDGAMQGHYYTPKPVVSK